MAQKANPKKSSITDDPRASQALQHYETGCAPCRSTSSTRPSRCFRKFCRRQQGIERPRAIHLSICNQHLERSTTTQFKTVEEHFDYAVSLMNVGDYVTAREHIEKLVKQSPKTDSSSMACRARLPHRPRGRLAQAS